MEKGKKSRKFSSNSLEDPAYFLLYISLQIFQWSLCDIWHWNSVSINLQMEKRNKWREFVKWLIGRLGSSSCIYIYLQIFQWSMWYSIPYQCQKLDNLAVFFFRWTLSLLHNISIHYVVIRMNMCDKLMIIQKITEKKQKQTVWPAVCLS